MQENAYIDPDLILGLYNDPADEILLAEYLLATSGVQTGILSANLGGANTGAGGAGSGGLVGGGGGGGGGGVGDIGRCFTGENEVVFFNGLKVEFEDLYERREEFIGRGMAAFATTKHIMPGKLLWVSKTRVKRLLHVSFENEPGPMRMRATHRFFLPTGEFREMEKIEIGASVSNYVKAWSESVITGKEFVDYPDGIDVYNLSVDTWHDYLVAYPGAAPKAVSNVKRQPNDGEFELQ